MAPPSDPSTQDVMMRRKKSAPFKFLVPLIYAPVLPLIRLSLRHRPVLRDRLFTAVLAGAFVHGMYLVKNGSIATSEASEPVFLTQTVDYFIGKQTDIYDAESK